MSQKAFKGKFLTSLEDCQHVKDLPNHQKRHYKNLDGAINKRSYLKSHIKHLLPPNIDFKFRTELGMQNKVQNINERERRNTIHGRIDRKDYSEGMGLDGFFTKEEKSKSVMIDWKTKLEDYYNYYRLLTSDIKKEVDINNIKQLSKFLFDNYWFILFFGGSSSQFYNKNCDIWTINLQHKDDPKYVKIPYDLTAKNPPIGAIGINLEEIHNNWELLCSLELKKKNYDYKKININLKPFINQRNNIFSFKTPEGINKFNNFIDKIIKE